LSRAYLSGYTDEEIEYFWGIRLYEALFDTYRFSNLLKSDDEGNSKCMLPKYAYLVLQRLYRESLISMDRVGLIACGSLEAAQSALIKEFHNGELGNGWLHIPSEEELEGLAQSGMYNLKANHQMSDYDFVPIRLRCMRQFWSVYLSDPNDETRALVDAEVTKLFGNFLPSPDTEEEQHVLNLVASVGMDMVIHDEKASDGEIRLLLNELLDYVAPPSAAICLDPLVNSTQKRKAINYLRENGAPRQLLRSLARLAINSGERFEENNKLLRKLLQQLDIGEAEAAFYLTDEYREVEHAVDPLMDNLVARARARLAGEPEPEIRQRRLEDLKWKDMSLAEKIRYSGDRNDGDVLGNVYHLNEMIRQYESYREKLVMSDIPNEYLNHLHLTPEISPRVCKIIDRVRKVLGYADPLEVFCEKPGYGLNACAWEEVAKDGRRGIVNINPEAIETLEDDELAYLIGHEIGHLIYRHTQWGFVVKSKEDKSTMLPFIGENLYWEWQQKCEISADRAGAVAAGSADAALRAQLKVCYGLSPRNLDTNADVLLSQLKVVQDAENMEGSADWMKKLDHPIDPLRINALKAFCDVYYAKGVKASNLKPEHLEQVDERIAKSYELLRRYPRTKAGKAAMQIVALHGLEIINSDGRIEDRELAELLEILMSEHTDNPIDELIGNVRKRNKSIAAASEILAEDGDDELKEFTMIQLAYLALVDGSISDEDRSLLCKVAESLGLDAFNVDSTLQTAAEMSNFPVDFLLEDEVEKVQKMLEEASQIS
jgi:tellurite resistance protein